MLGLISYLSRRIQSKDLEVSWSRRSFTYRAESVYWVYAPPNQSHSSVVEKSLSVILSEAVVYQGLSLSLGRKWWMGAYLWFLGTAPPLEGP